VQQFLKQTLLLDRTVAEGKLTGNDQLDVSARPCGVEMQLRADAFGPLPHSPDSKVPILPSGDALLVEANAVVSHHDGKIPGVGQLNVEFGPSRVRAGVGIAS
jgi:hypothetical protein